MCHTRTTRRTHPCNAGIFPRHLFLADSVFVDPFRVETLLFVTKSPGLVCAVASGGFFPPKKSAFLKKERPNPKNLRKPEEKHANLKKTQNPHPPSREQRRKSARPLSQRTQGRNIPFGGTPHSDLQDKSWYPGWQ